MQPISQQFEQEIQPYINNLRIELKDFFDAKMEADFRIQAAAVHAKGENLCEFAQKFLEKQKTRERLTEHFRDRIPVEFSMFEADRPKTQGTSAGGVIRKKYPTPYPALFMQKTAPKGTYSGDGDFIEIEYITAPLYTRWLYDRAPVIAGTKDAKAALRSKFLPGFKNFSACSPQEIKQATGAEKVFAAILFGAENDPNTGNIGLITIKDVNGNDQRVFAKIDHGWSAAKFFTKPEKALEYLANIFNKYNYQGKIILNVTQLKEAIDAMTTITDEEIDNIIEIRTQELVTMGAYLGKLPITDNENTKPNSSYNNSSSPSKQEFVSQLQDSFKKQKQAMIQLSANLDIVAKISGPGIDDVWRNGQWLQDIKGNDPIAWAVVNGKQIEGQDPIAWAVTNNYWNENKELELLNLIGKK